MSDVTQILTKIEEGDPAAAKQLLPMVYAELRQLAASKLANENRGQTLQATALVHEAYLRVTGCSADSEDIKWDSRGHFFAAAAEAMRRILIDAARRRQAEKRGGGLQRQELVDDAVEAPRPDAELLEINGALDALARVDSRKAELVKLRYFAGLTIAETAKMLGISTTTAERDWSFARAWLHQEILREKD